MYRYHRLHSTAVVLLASIFVSACSDERGVTKQQDNGEIIEFGNEESLERFTSVGRSPMFAALPDGRDVIAWVSAPDSSSNARLYISVAGSEPTELRDSLGPIEAHAEAPPKVAVAGDGTLHVIYVVGKEVPGRRFPLSALRYVRSTNEGVTWSEAVTVTDDSEFGSHNFHALTASDDGRVVVSWLDGRHGPSSSSAYITVSNDNGRSWNRNIRADTTASCPCCRTALAIAPDGTIALAWRSILPGGIRDIVVSRSRDGGTTWATPKRVREDNWEFNGCPHAGPSLQYDQHGALHVIWWTGKEGEAGVWYARSLNGGDSFEAAVEIDVADFSRPSHPQMVVRGDTVSVVWDDGTQGVPWVKIRRSINRGQSFSVAQIISDTTMSSSFPVIASTDHGLAVAWTSQTGHSHHAHESAEPDMSEPGAVKKLAKVGDAIITVRRQNVQ